jgi:nucleoside-diphosphate-sugar epimerase
MVRRRVPFILLRFIGFGSLCQALTTTAPQSCRLVILGLGRVGREVARQATFAHSIVGTIRGNVTANESDDRCHYIPYQETELVLEAVRGCTHLLVTIPPPSETVGDATDEPNAFFDRVVTALPIEPCWIGVLSTTGVYGNHDGHWVTEETECRAESPSARRYLAYEAAWQRRARPQALYLFRCAGIYGGAQSALHTVYQKGLPSTTTSTKDVTNRIHVSDLAAAIVASMRKHDRGESNTAATIYNLADDFPAARAAVMEYAAELLRGIEVVVPDSTAPEASSMRGARRQAEAKRVANDKMKRELLSGGPLRFPTYREGLATILLDRTNPWWQRDNDS